MRKLDCLLILNHTNNDQDDEVREGIEALKARNVGKATKILVVDFGSSSEDPQLDLSDVPKQARVGIYVIGHAWRNMFGEGSDFQIPAAELADFIAKLAKKFDSPDLAKICLVGCGIAGGAKDTVNENEGSYLQRFCFILGTVKGLTPKVAGWSHYVTIERNVKSPNHGRKKVKPWNEDRTEQASKRKVVDDDLRLDQKFAYVCREGSVAKLELADWSDKA